MFDAEKAFENVLMKKKVAPFLVVALMTNSALSADSLMIEKMKNFWLDARVKLGPLRVQPALLIQEAGYDSNVYFYQNTEPIGDWTLTAGPALDIYLPLGDRFLFSFYLSPRYVFFKEIKNERTWNFFGNGSVRFYILRFLFTLEAGKSDAKARWNTEIDIRPRLVRESQSAGVEFYPGRKMSLSAAASHQWMEYEETEYEGFPIGWRLNRHDYFLTLAGRYRVSRRMEMFLEYEHGFHLFTREDLVSDKTGRAVYAGIDFDPLGRFEGRLNIGYRQLFDSASGETIYEGMVGDTGISYRFLRFLTFRAQYQRDVLFSVWADYFLMERYGAGVSFYIFRKIRVDYSYGLGHHGYPGEGGVDEGPVRYRGYDFDSHSLGFYFRLKERTGIGFVVTRMSRTFDYAPRPVRRDVFALNLIYDF